MSFNFLKENTGFLVRIDDVSENMNWEMMDRCEKLLDQYNIKPLLGVIPFNKDKELLKFTKKDNFWQKVLEWQNKGWEISMHGFEHKYSINTKKKDYFSYGGMSEFFSLPYEIQKKKIVDGLNLFKTKKVNIKSFFAPNHTYDTNTFKALRESGIETVIDGYGLIPYSKYGLKFIPQLFYKLTFLPFGIQSSQIHLNDWSDTDFYKFKDFIEKNKNSILDYDGVIQKVNSVPLTNFINLIVEFFLKILRKLKIN